MIKMEKLLNLTLLWQVLGASTNYALTETTTVLPLRFGDPEAEYFTDNIVEVSADQWDLMNGAATLNDLHKILGIPPENQIQAGVVSFRTSVSRSSTAVRYLDNPDLTVCSPELTTVDLPLPNNQGVVHYPKCIKANRCGGCCVNTARICKPTFSRKLIVKVIKLTKMNTGSNANISRRRRRNRGNSRRERATDAMAHETMNVTVTEHTKCACQCKITEADCDILLQEYNEPTCSCNCKNRDTREKCTNDSLRYWSEENCACKCRDSHSASCSSGTEFDQNTCKCKRLASLPSNYDYLLRKAEDKSALRIK